ncbi:DUF2381 family protein [Vitiosangium sp. GDMCC 1.1324]|uniref:DUF2381 family protein n=1 Tax=Vitiosangium sp. (strain GDMCC 1.1324) TaxID=2138576 RepID=UPI00130D9B31|nr:DUF2381 family protein [Vitiosangium sp. GDMCC 1.1324]
MPALFAVLALLASAPTAAQSSPASPDTGGERQLLLSADPQVQEHEVRIGSNTPINLFFDGQVQLVWLEGREHFRRVTVTEDSILLMASRALKLGQRLRMPVRFLDGAAPERVDFILVVVPPAQAERHVEVYRPRSPESGQEQAREERELARQCQAELARERAERKRLGGLTGLLVSRQMDEEGVVTRRLSGALRWLAGEQLTAWQPFSYRASSPGTGGDGEQPKRVRVAVELWLRNESAQSWLAAGAELVSGSGVRWSATAWQEAPVIPGTNRQRVVVEAEMSEAEARGAFVLELWEEGRTRPVTFGGVSFP